MSAPNLLLPMWFLLFASLGWNFLEYGIFRGDVEVGWIVCGVVFELMALPVLFLIPMGSQAASRSEPRARRSCGGGSSATSGSLRSVSLGAWIYVLVST